MYILCAFMLFIYNIYIRQTIEVSAKILFELRSHGLITNLVFALIKFFHAFFSRLYQTGEKRKSIMP